MVEEAGEGISKRCWRAAKGEADVVNEQRIAKMVVLLRLKAEQVSFSRPSSKNRRGRGKVGEGRTCMVRPQKAPLAVPLGNAA